MDSVEQWHTIADERSAEIVRLRAALEQALNERDAAHERIAELDAKLETAQSNINALGESWRIPCERAEARIAELEADEKTHGEDWASAVRHNEQLKTRIARAVAELQNHVLPLCSEEGEIEHAVKRALEALR